MQRETERRDLIQIRGVSKRGTPSRFRLLILVAQGTWCRAEWTKLRRDTSPTWNEGPRAWGGQSRALADKRTSRPGKEMVPLVGAGNGKKFCRPLADSFPTWPAPCEICVASDHPSSNGGAPGRIDRSDAKGKCGPVG
uniref:Uncharacterized protein n=1 Tax=Trichuris muris TaxID=70415 RepID=A0A5S6R407_TRIMR